MNQIYDVVIAGCGASGMAAAVKAAEQKRKVLVLEKGERAGRKILASGNGRCNIMNSGTPRYYGDPQFALQVLKRCPRQEIERFLKHYGLVLTEEEDGRIYPLSHQSASVLSVLKTALEATKAEVKYKCSVDAAEIKGGIFEIHTGNGELYRSKRFIVTCGGTAQPKLGGSSDGYGLLSSFGHSVIPVFPALVPLITDLRSISGLSGIRAECTVSLYDSKTCLHRETGEILFTEYGVSGICIMQCARFVNCGETHLKVDFLGCAFRTRDEAIRELLRRKKQFSAFSPVVLLSGILHERISYAVLKQAGIPMRGETAGDLSDEEIIRVVKTAYEYRIDIKGTKGFDYAQVTAGGADCREFKPETMESCIVPGLYAAGEVLNVDGDCGGYNLMFALSSGINAGMAV